MAAGLSGGSSIVAAALWFGSARSASAETLHRFAIVAGNDSGGADTRPLLYAGADARKVYDILTRLGGVRTEDAALIIDGRAADLLDALAHVGRAAAKPRAAASARRSFSTTRGMPKTAPSASGKRGSTSSR